MRSFSVLLAALFIASCSDAVLQSPTAPVDQLSAQAAVSIKAGLPGHLPSLAALWWKKPLKRVIPVSKVIGPSGGTITMPTGLTIVFPEGALSAPLTITVTPDNKYVAYRMDPAGTKFLKDVTVTQPFGPIQSAALLRGHIYAAYIADDNAKLSGKIPVAEIEPSSTTLSPLTGLPQAQVWKIKHFSRYMLASD